MSFRDEVAENQPQGVVYDCGTGIEGWGLARLLYTVIGEGRSGRLFESDRDVDSRAPLEGIPQRLYPFRFGGRRPRITAMGNGG